MAVLVLFLFCIIFLFCCYFVYRYVEAIVRLWKIPGLPAELFVNYDCGLYSINLYEEIMKMLSKVLFNVRIILHLYRCLLIRFSVLLIIVYFCRMLRH